MPGELTRRDTAALKAIAISAIVFHNFFHLLGQVHENEVDFEPTRFPAFIAAVQDPRESIQAVFSFFGHYGVQVFIFLSAYGLAKRYWDESGGVGFVWRRIVKLYPWFLMAVGCGGMLTAVAAGHLWMPALADYALGSTAALLGISSLLPNFGLPPIGPWWFIPFIVQWYCLWPLMKRFADRFGRRGLLILSLAAMILTASGNSALAPWRINFLETPLGHMPELCLGIAAGRYGLQLRPSRYLLAGIGLIAGNVYGPLWLLTFPSALILSLGLYTSVKRLGWNVALLAPIGACSMQLFLFNGLVRIPFVEVARSGSWIGVLVCGALSAAFSFGLAHIMETGFVPWRSRAAGV